MNEIKIKNNNGILTVSSLQIARDFGKRHDHVICDIEKIINMIKGDLPNFEEASSESLNFGISEYFIETKHLHTTNNQWHKCYDSPVTDSRFLL